MKDFINLIISKYKDLLTDLFSPRDLPAGDLPLFTFTKLSTIKTENKFSQNNETHNNRYLILKKVQPYIAENHDSGVMGYIT